MTALPHSRIVAQSAALHFLVDSLCLCCLYLMAGGARGANLTALFLTYNVLAFMTQPLSGMLTDGVSECRWILLSSVTLLSLAAITAASLTLNGYPSMGLYAVAVMLGTGNSLFHTWGGRMVARVTANDTRALGTFVATGAVGLTVGIVACSWMLLAIMLAATTVLTYSALQFDPKMQAVSSTESPARTAADVSLQWVVLLSLMLYVTLRSLMGEALGSHIVKTPTLMLTLAATAAAGKVLGGWMARYGRKWVLLLTATAGATACLLLQPGGMPVALAGIFLVNCTMPVTLYWANASLPGREGLAFGLLAAALVPGYLLAYII